MRYRDNTRELAERRRQRKLAASRRGSHPLSHVDPDKSYEWMRSDCAAYDSARQSREDGLIATITQISSAALLAIPGLLFGSNQDFPVFNSARTLYLGIALFLISLTLAMLEQYLSAKAYREQASIAREYYLLKSDKIGNPNFVKWVRWCRNAACIFFGFAVIVSAAALMALERITDG